MVRFVLDMDQHREPGWVLQSAEDFVSFASFG